MKIEKYTKSIDKLRTNCIRLFYKLGSYRSPCLQLEKETYYILEEEVKLLDPILERYGKQFKERRELEIEIQKKDLLENIFVVTKDIDLVKKARMINKLIRA